ncbi:hypothetical protein Pan258_42120 [Symmachiella dynata]|uniref:hypothetical protein n=1 Tax=Symmachiella dynata TaxID=2527995 RepID=UPI00118C4E08|nr:hypothetical protein [Symmachiella dynata]QDT50155.1 hypothetical protein Pan258_42120 [Symmachiella dynata]
MTYRIKNIELYVRETPPGRMAFAIGKQSAKGPQQRLTSPLGHVRLELENDRGDTTFGCAGDRLSVRWLDKRPGRERGLKLRELVDLIEFARETYLQSPQFETPFAQWQPCHKTIMREGRRRNQEDLTAAFASALFERALLDGAARLEGRSLFEMIHADRLGIRPAQVHPELHDLPLPKILPPAPATEFYIRHTVGLADPLTADDLPEKDRVNDGLPETLAEYIQTDGVVHFKVKISGQPDHDLGRLERLWDLIPKTEETVITLDANEAYTDMGRFRDFVENLETQSPGCFQHISYIEQPLLRSFKVTPADAKILREIGESKPVIIDEADGTLHSFKDAHANGYSGTSHKNCKGFFKSLMNYALIAHYGLEGESNYLSGEDLQNLPVVPLHQDFVSASILGLNDCERNGHHYNYGLSLLSDQDKTNVTKHHRDLYVKRGEEWFLNIVDGKVRCASLQCPGYGVNDEPDWASMTNMRQWLQTRFPA